METLYMSPEQRQLKHWQGANSIHPGRRLCIWPLSSHIILQKVNVTEVLAGKQYHPAWSEGCT
ncbi:hypothetical protein M408DRAFT_27866 [Serendipita vermifera MAFF 305830]|uniref:Uncharacterized protein n=1 Tax=Serendipita vermifera MAFF 305830 TaxID=933852 RepID=A0A0C3ATR8_SERVB|nr:hypothetical protein M408DRAFT_27866 [Serendipita vermifera MAFF 305830]